LNVSSKVINTSSANRLLRSQKWDGIRGRLGFLACVMNVGKKSRKERLAT
jgi:hypothetical protein